ncbi:hypothetical protein [Streptomyces sp. NPDC055056]
MSTGDIPIYDRLVRERGDVLTETRKTAEQTQAKAQRALDWREVRRLVTCVTQIPPTAVKSKAPVTVDWNCRQSARSFRK